MSSVRSFVTFALSLTLWAGTGGYAAAQQITYKDRIPATVGDLTDAQLVEVRDQTGVLLLHGTLKTTKNDPRVTERKADLESPTGQKAKGHVDIDVERKDGVVNKDDVEIVLDNMPAMINCDLLVDGQRVTTFVTSKTGKAQLKLNRKLSSR